MRFIKYVCLVSAIFFVSGCAPTHTINYLVRPVTTFEVEDRRPPEDKETSYGRLEGKYAISKFGDSAFQPDRLSLLKTLLEERYGSKLSGKKIEVSRLRTLVYLAPRTNLDALINSAHGLQIYPGVPDPSKDWWIFEITTRIDEKIYSQNIPEETPEVKFCPSCYQDIRSRVTINALTTFVTGMGRHFDL